MNDRINTPEAREAAEAESQRLARVQKVEARRLLDDEERKRLQRERTAKSRAKTKAASVVETSEARERREKQERSDVADRLRQERDEDILFELGGHGLEEFGPNTPEENSELQNKIDDYLAPFESHLPFERLYGRLSADPVGRAILRHFGIDPLSGYYIDSQGIHKSPSPGGRQVEMTDGSSEWISTDRIAEYNEKNIAFKSQATLATEFRSSSPQISEMQIFNLKTKIAATRAKAVADEKEKREWLQGLERQYLAARRASKEKQVREIKERGEAV